MNRAEYGALKEYIAAGGDIEKARAAIARNPFLTEAAQERALEVFRHHKSYRGKRCAIRSTSRRNCPPKRYADS
ncbi:hypothetical protein [Micromonospora sp. ALFpr18c]|uniref:hypothetical protein n=1 Tax=Micromonospora sp. ALFpr18c TaxID=1458665 RepID=UPI001788CABF|nr:hypothetical protein [Micromonospora sp. ALFpr18c]